MVENKPNFYCIRNKTKKMEIGDISYEKADFFFTYQALQRSLHVQGKLKKNGKAKKDMEKSY